MSSLLVTLFNFKDLGVNGKIILKQMREQDERTWTETMYLRTGTSGRVLCTLRSIKREKFLDPSKNY